MADIEQPGGHRGLVRPDDQGKMGAVVEGLFLGDDLSVRGDHVRKDQNAPLFVLSPVAHAMVHFSVVLQNLLFAMYAFNFSRSIKPSILCDWFNDKLVRQRENTPFCPY